MAVAAPPAGGGEAAEAQERALWSRTALPAVRDVGPDGPVELGVRFRVDVPGEVVGIRFFRAPANSGPHVASLWTAEGGLLARAVRGESEVGGWRRVDFPRPISVVPGKLYVASYHAPTGHFSVDHDYFAGGGVDRPPLHAPADAPESPNGVFAYGSAGTFPAQGHRASNYWVDVVFRPRRDAADALLRIEIGPAHGALWVGSEARLSARGVFGDGSWRDVSDLAEWRSADASVAAVGGAGIVRAAGAGATTVSATLGAVSGAASVVCVSRPMSASGLPAPASIWHPATPLAAADAGPDRPSEAGVRFRVDAAGYVTAIRFLRSAGDWAPAVARLWSGDGALLAEGRGGAGRAGEWDEVLLPRPVAVDAGERYVASREMPAGALVTRGYFGEGIANPPLRVEVGTPANVGGVFAEGRPGTFPLESWNSANPWVDVVFVPLSRGPALSAIRVEPEDREVELGEEQRLRAIGQFDDGSQVELSRVVQWRSSDRAALQLDAAGRATALRAGPATVEARLGEVAGAALIRVRPLPPAPDQGPGGPILVVTSPANGFSRYLAEILRAEGWNAFLVTDISRVDRALLDRHLLVILGDFPLSAEQAELLDRWVRDGGNLVAMRPDARLAPLLGLRRLHGEIEEGQIQVLPGPGPGAGITPRAMQVHGAADLYALAGAREIASLLRGGGRHPSFPAVTVRAAGEGQAAAFVYDLARSVVYTRQGNPAWSGQARSGQRPRRSHDLFFGPAAHDRRPDWLDFGRIDVPQADEQQRLLTNLLVQMVGARRPLPRFWYLPSGHRAAVVLTGDDHARLGPSRRFRELLGRSKPGCSVADWECLRSTAYIYAGDPLDAAEALRYQRQGFEISLHLTTDCADFGSPEELEGHYASQLGTFALNYPGLASPRTTRTHCVVWSDYDTQPRVQQRHGIRLDANYYYWPASWVRDRPGFMTGSALPMRFSDRAGRVLDVYQVATQMTDESGQSYPATIQRLLDGALGPSGYYGVFTANMHTDEPSSPGTEAIVSAALARGVPVISALQLLEWLEARDQSSFESLEWNGRELSFSVRAPPAARNLRGMIPLQVGRLRTVGLTRDGVDEAFSVETVKGVRYATFAALPGRYRARYR